MPVQSSYTVAIPEYVQQHLRNIAHVGAQGRTDQQCMGRWKRHLDPTITREAWTDEEDAKLHDQFLVHGSQWSSIARSLPGRTAQQCRARYALLWFFAFLHQGIDAAPSPWSTGEDGRVFEHHDLTMLCAFQS